MIIQPSFLKVDGFLKIYDPNNGEIFVDKCNAIHYENISIAMAQSLSDYVDPNTGQPIGFIYGMAFGNGGSSVDPTGIITYLPPNTTGQNADLYNQTYFKVVDQNAAANTDPTNNNMTVLHTSGNVYTDILVTCLLDYGEPAGQQAFDNSTNFNGEYVFDELGLKCWNGSATNLRLITHVIFHPVQKSLNRQIQIDYTLRIQTLTNLSVA
jgi:hypothetical protein